MTAERSGSVDRLDTQLARIRTHKRVWGSAGETRRTASNLGLFEVIEDVIFSSEDPQVGASDDKRAVGVFFNSKDRSGESSKVYLSFLSQREKHNILTARVILRDLSVSPFKTVPKTINFEENLDLSGVNGYADLKVIVSDYLLSVGCNVLDDGYDGAGSLILRERARAETAEAEVERLQRIIDSSARNARASADTLSALDPQGHFRVLGLHPMLFDGLTEEQGNALISAVYRLTAKRVHSDIGGTDEQMIRVNAAKTFFDNPANRGVNK